MDIASEHKELDMFSQQLTLDVWHEKYRRGDEKDPFDSMVRVARAIYANDKEDRMSEAYQAMQKGLWLPGGRINAGAGTEHRVTLMNCYVCRTIPDSMNGIADALKDAMLTMQQGGGIGMDFSSLRPKGANLHRTGVPASGPGPFMDMWDAMCATIMSAGWRRGAMMATLADWHPFLLDFIEAKHEQDRWKNFNVSILISDAFMEAVRYDQDWELYFPCEPHAAEDCLGTFDDDNNVRQYIYTRLKARELWEKILRSTYEYSEPGVIFIDRVNDLNNLQYLEDIRCSNPCGEQMLPPDGACNLGAVNLARMVDNPFTSEARFRWDLLGETVKIGVRFLDNVIDITGYPLARQKKEQMLKRRIGLGITGLADAFVQMRTRYGSPESEVMTRKIMKFIAIKAYEASVELAKEKGPFDAYRSDQFLERPFIRRLPETLQESIRKSGIRNGVLLTIAPVGTGSIYYGNVASGLEPIFSHEQHRNVRQPDGTWKPYRADSYAFRLYKHVNGIDSSAALEDMSLPDYMSTALEVGVGEHIRIQAAAQEWVDASVSKTINCPEDMSFDDFKLVYDRAYDSGCKGCTTYKPSEVRGSILSVDKKDGAKLDPEQYVVPRPEVLKGQTYKIKWPNLPSSLYLTINRDEHGKPFEVFIASKSSQNAEWTTTVSLLITAIMRMQKEIGFLPKELKQIHSSHDGAWVNGTYYGSLPAYIGHVLERDLTSNIHADVKVESIEAEEIPEEVNTQGAASYCPKCNELSLVHQEGCKTCMSCGYSSCG